MKLLLAAVLAATAFHLMADEQYTTKCYDADKTDKDGEEHKKSYLSQISDELSGFDSNRVCYQIPKSHFHNLDSPLFK